MDRSYGGIEPAALAVYKLRIVGLWDFGKGIQLQKDKALRGSKGVGIRCWTVKV